MTGSEIALAVQGVTAILNVLAQAARTTEITPDEREQLREQTAAAEGRARAILENAEMPVPALPPGSPG